MAARDKLQRLQYAVRGIDNLSGIYSDMRRNAREYTRIVNQGQRDWREIRDVVTEDVGQFERRLDWMQGDRRAAMEVGMDSLGLSPAELAEIEVELRDHLGQLFASRKGTRVDFLNALQAVLDTVPDVRRFLGDA
jgi:hypothetical protein